jgi:hypothetical protein
MRAPGAIAGRVAFSGDLTKLAALVCLNLIERKKQTFADFEWPQPNASVIFGDPLCFDAPAVGKLITCEMRAAGVAIAFGGMFEGHADLKKLVSISFTTQDTHLKKQIRPTLSPDIVGLFCRVTWSASSWTGDGR